MDRRLEQIISYHEASKHHFDRYAPGPGFMDWATQPDPFRRLEGAPVLRLERLAPEGGLSYDQAFRSGAVSPAPVDRRSVSQLFFDTLALSAWKKAGSATWALRVNPSSGNLHPTEGYLLCGPVPDLTDEPVVCHYAPREHILEVRIRLSFSAWRALSEAMPEGTVFVAFTSIFWREAWKYGERAFRYCALDLGHALGALGFAAAALGWETRVLDDLSTEQLAQLLGIDRSHDAEVEHPECMAAVFPRPASGGRVFSFGPRSIPDISDLPCLGKPNRLSRGHVRWRMIESAARATEKTVQDEPPFGNADLRLETQADSRRVVPALRGIIHQRRSAVAMDARTSMPVSAFYLLLTRTLPSSPHPVFDSLAWPPHVHTVLYVHRVDGLPPGLYILVRSPRMQALLQPAMRRSFAWERPRGCPDSLPLYLLAEGDLRRVAAQVSCHQDIAGEGCFCVSMISEFDGPLSRFGPWFYTRLFWECGMIGQVLYLEAEAAGLRGTGIGCFFDNPVHELLGLEGRAFQDLYHFTVGAFVEDRRISTLPAYPQVRD